jgi:hypothetical protein
MVGPVEGERLVRRLWVTGTVAIGTFFCVYFVSRLLVPLVLVWLDGLSTFSIGRDLINQIKSVGAFGFGLTAGGLVGRVTWKRLTPSGPVLPASSGDSAAGLAESVRRQWTDEIAARNLRHPEPIRVRWSSSGRGGVAASPAAVLAGAGVGGRVTRLRLHGEATQVVELVNALPARQVVIIGPPGAGKTVLAVMFTLAQLDRNGRDDPVPVLLTLSGWNPGREHLQTWLARRIGEDYPALTNVARYGAGAPVELVRSGRVLPVLDGLDEIPDPLLPQALDGLNDFAARYGLVVTCRGDEYERAVVDGGQVLARAAVVEIEPVAADDAVAYLIGASPAEGRRWAGLVTGVRSDPDGPVAVALRTPLMISLCRSVFRDPASHPGELLDHGRFPEPAAVEELLLAQFVPRAYAPRLRPPQATRRPHYPPARAQAWLTFLARHITWQAPGGTDLAWWELHRAVRPWVLGLVAGLAVLVLLVPLDPLTFSAALALVVGRSVARRARTARTPGRRRWLVAALLDGPLDGLVVILAVAPLAALTDFRFQGELTLRAWQIFADSAELGAVAALASAIAGAFAGAHPGVPRRASAPLARLPGQLARGVGIASMASVPIGLIVGFVAWLLNFGAPAWLLPSVVVGVTAVLGLMVGPPLGLGRWLQTPSDRPDSPTPRSLLRADRTALVTVAVATGLPFTALLGALILISATLLAEVSTSQLAELLIGTGLVGVLFGLLVAVSSGGASILFYTARLWLGLTRQLPLRLLRFLDDACERGVLRRAGATYQLRHARLQIHLVGRGPADGWEAGDVTPATVPELTARRPGRGLSAAAAIATVALVLAGTAAATLPRLSVVREGVARGLIEQSWGDQSSDPMLALRLLIAAYQLDSNINGPLDDEVQAWQAIRERPLHLSARVVAVHQGRQLLATADAASYTVWRLPPGAAAQRLTTTPLPAAATALLFSPDGDALGVIDGDGALSIWDITDPVQPPRQLATVTLPLGHGAVAVGPGGHSFAVIDQRQVTFRRTDGVQGQRTLTFDPNDEVEALAIDADGESVIAEYVTGGVTSEVLWHLETNQHQSSYASTHDATALAFRPHGDPVSLEVDLLGGFTDLTFGFDTTRVFPYVLHSVTISPDGGAAAGIADGAVVVFDLEQDPPSPADLVGTACTLAGRGLTQQEWADHLGAFRIFFPYRETCPARPGD